MNAKAIWLIYNVNKNFEKCKFAVIEVIQFMCSASRSCLEILKFSWIGLLHLVSYIALGKLLSTQLVYLYYLVDIHRHRFIY